jgi:transposase InsO family protein
VPDASQEYMAVLEKHGMVPSMSRPANPYDNASCESFLKTSGMPSWLTSTTNTLTGPRAVEMQAGYIHLIHVEAFRPEERYCCVHRRAAAELSL